MTSFLTLVICSLSVLGGVMAATIRLQGHVGGDVEIRCSHQLAQNNVKYFCNKACLKDTDILIKSKSQCNPNTRGRYKIYDEGNGVFVVTISGLEKSDSGTYWCGVERSFSKDTFNEVILTVLEAPEPTSSRTTPSLPDQRTSVETVKRTEVRTEAVTSTSKTITREFTTTDTTTSSANRQLIYIGSGFASLVLISAICLFILIKLTKQRKAAKHKSGKVQSDWNKHINPEGEKVPQNPTNSNQQSTNQKTPPNQRPDPDPSSTVYSNITPHSHDDLNYSTVNFPRPSDDIHYSTVIFVKDRDSNSSPLDTTGPSEPLYSTVRPTDRPQTAENNNDVIYSSIRGAR